MRRAATTSVLTSDLFINESPQDGIGDRDRNRITILMPLQDHGGRPLHVLLLTQRYVFINGLLNGWVVNQRFHLYEFRRGENGSDHRFNAAVLCPLLLFLK